ncbi:hypothetical protein DUNSADRAFT_5377 [Dunaliella salina]|uniref:Encoded protein n=1 Tax=Dunaliella salina TaxID=3046 RepID=A0ABQ7GQI5_DUNSA|nr:hypothetical protein DUNSADRAFT_5377 [Dunaliella salina]|eukprot:KAF5836798.1 hypothetical protein DUNSADRAFT_5377 [Dunaliella salina]
MNAMQNMSLWTREAYFFCGIEARKQSAETLPSQESMNTKELPLKTPDFESNPDTHTHNSNSWAKKQLQRLHGTACATWQVQQLVHDAGFGPTGHGPFQAPSAERLLCLTAGPYAYARTPLCKNTLSSRPFWSFKMPTAVAVTNLVTLTARAPAYARPPRASRPLCVP